MTDRDTFAAAALTGMMARVAGKAESFAEAAYKLADAMLRERDKEQSHQDNRSQPSKRKWVHGCTGILWDGEVGMEETDDGPVYKIGDGKTEWDDLPTLVKSTNHDAVPEAIAKSCDDCGPQATPELGNHVLAPPQDGTGDTQGPVAWAVMANDWFHDVRLSEDGAEWYSSYLNNKAGKGKCRVVPLYRQPQPTLTDAEREAVAYFAREFKGPKAAALRCLLERLRGKR